MFKQYFSDRSKRFQHASLLIVVLMIAGTGTYLLNFGHAATPYASINADKGTLANSATVQSDSTASDGKYVQFGGAPHTTTKMIGLNGTYSDSNNDYLQDARSMGVQWMRDEQWGDNTSYEPTCQNATQISQATCGVPLVASNMAAHNIHIFPLVNDYSTSWVTASGRQQWVNQIVHAATTYAKGGTFWQGKTDYGSPVVEVGNEVYGSWYNWPDKGWLYPGDYALMLKQAAIAVNSATNGRIKLLASVSTDYYDTLDTSGGSGGTWRHWAQDMKAAVPDIESYIGGVVSHAYGDIASIGVCPGENPAGQTTPVNSCPNSTDPNWSHQSLYTIHSQWGVPVYVTEEGQKAASDTAGNGQVGYANQAAAVNYYFNELKNNSWEVGIFWYNQKDYQAFDPSTDNGWALIDSNNTRKQAWYAYQTQATHFPN